MEERIFKIEQDKLLLNILYDILSRGVTKGITEKQYFNILNKTVAALKKDKLFRLYEIKIEEGDIQEIVKCINDKNRYREAGLILKKQGNNTIILPTYDFRKSEYNEDSLGWYPRQEDIFDDVVKKIIPSYKGSSIKLSSVSPPKLDLAKKVAAFFINDTIERYVDSEIEEGSWPKQCKDIDEYIFKRDIASVIDAKGKRKVFKRAYIEAVNVMCEIIKSPKTEVIISNDKSHLLGYANFLKMFHASGLQFLASYDYKSSRLYNPSMDVQVFNNVAICKKTICTYFDPYDDSDEFKNENAKILQKEVEIMEKRIGKII